MDVLIRIAQLLLSLSILIILHELGHFLLARLFKVRVEKFFLFFDAGFALFRKKIGETEYGIGWLPLGGYVKISGMIDESMDREQMKQPPQPWEFRSKRAWQRLLIMLGGVLMNFLLALVIYVGVLFAWGESYIPNDRLTDGLRFEETFHEIGFRDGDRIIALDGEEVVKWRTIHHDILVNEVKVVTVDRQGELLDIEIPEDMTKRMLRVEYAMAPRIPCTIGALVEEGALNRNGARLGDRIISVNGTPTPFYSDFMSNTGGVPNKSFELELLRGQDTIPMTITTSAEGLFGFSTISYGEVYKDDIEIIKYTFFQSIPAGVKHGINITGSYLKQLKMLLQPKKTEAHKELGGFIKIGKLFPTYWNWESFWNMTAFLSIILAIMNILPIPALDGGHVMFTLFEMITGRKPGDKFLEYAQIVGMVLLLGLLLYANLNDVIGLFQK